MSKAKPFPGSIHSFELFPGFFFAYVHTEAELQKIAKWAGQGSLIFPIPGMGRCTAIENDKTGDTICLVSVNPRPTDSPVSEMAMLVHECSHVIDRLWRSIGERKAGAETRAYALQVAFQLMAVEMTARRKADKEALCASP